MKAKFLLPKYFYFFLIQGLFCLIVFIVPLTAQALQNPQIVLLGNLDFNPDRNSNFINDINPVVAEAFSIQPAPKPYCIEELDLQLGDVNAFSSSDWRLGIYNSALEDGFLVRGPDLLGSFALNAATSNDINRYFPTTPFILSPTTNSNNYYFLVLEFVGADGSFINWFSNSNSITSGVTSFAMPQNQLYFIEGNGLLRPDFGGAGSISFLNFNLIASPIPEPASIFYIGGLALIVLGGFFLKKIGFK